LLDIRFDFMILTMLKRRGRPKGKFPSVSEVIGKGNFSSNRFEWMKKRQKIKKWMDRSLVSKKVWQDRKSHKSIFALCSPVPPSREELSI